MSSPRRRKSNEQSGTRRPQQYPQQYNRTGGNQPQQQYNRTGGNQQYNQQYPQQYPQQYNRNQSGGNQQYPQQNNQQGGAEYTLPPGVKAQKDFTEEEIAERLKNFREVTDPLELVTTIPKGTWLKFLSIPKTPGEKPKFKVGGRLSYVDLTKGYLRIFSLMAKKNFSIQIKDNRIFVEDDEAKRKDEDERKKIFEKWKCGDLVEVNEEKEKVYEAFKKGMLISYSKEVKEMEKVYKEYKKGKLRECDAEFKDMQKVYKRYREGKLLEVRK